MNKQEQALELLLQKATTEPASRPEFLEKLLDSDVYCLGTTGRRDALQQKSTQIQAGESIHLRKWQREDGHSAIPFFLSIESLQQAISQEENYLQLNMRELFQVTAGDYLILNPNTAYAKEFSPQEVEALLTQGTGVQVEHLETKQPTDVLLGQPEVYPVKMVQQLCQFFEQRSQVDKAYLALIHDPQRDEKPMLIVGVLFNQQDFDSEKLMNQAGQVAYDSVGEPVYFSVVDLDEQGGLSGYLLETEAFYVQQDQGKGFWSKLFS